MKITIFDVLPYLKVFEDRMTKKGKYKKMMSGMRLYRKLKKCDGALEMVTVK
jgi:hypothetical protein